MGAAISRVGARYVAKSFCASRIVSRAGRFAASGRPGARLLLEGVPHRRGELSGALIATGGLAALECEAEQRVHAGDHLLVIARVLDVTYLAEAGQPLIRFRGRYPALATSPLP